jgi:hypothetical protein
MMTNKRKPQGRTMRYTAWVATEPDQLQDCVLTDVTNAGGRINVEDSTTVPDQFVLFLASNGSARRKCRVIWRNPNQVGVSFEGRVDGEEATLVPKPDANATPESAQGDAAALIADAEQAKSA